MPVKLKKKGGSKSGPLKSNRIQNVESTMRLFKQLVQSEEFYELEPVEILDVHLDESKSSFPKKPDDKPDYAFIGGILGRFVYSEQGKTIDKCKNFKPMNPSINNVPAVGEIVIGVQYLGQYYYTTQLNVFGNPNFNSQHGISRLKRKNTFKSLFGLDTPNTDDKSAELGYYLKKEKQNFL